MRARQLTSKCYQLVDFSLIFVSRILFSITLRVYTNRSSNTRSVQTNFHPLKITRIKFLAITNDREKEKGKKERKKSQQSASWIPGHSDSHPTTEPRFEDPRKLVERPPPPPPPPRPPMRRTKVARTVASKHA